MDIRKEILAEHSKAQCNKIVNWVGASQKRFNELFHLFLTDEYRVNQRAARAVSNCVIAHPDFIKNNFDNLIKNLHKPNLHNSIKRNSIRLLQHVEIPEKFQGEIMDICFKYIEAPEEAVAVKAFSLSVLANLSKFYPEIIPEIKFLINEISPHQTIAFKTRAKNILNMWK